MTKNRKRKLAWIVLTIWIGAIVFAQWLWVETSHRDFLSASSNRIAQETQFEEADNLRFVHFHDPECTCSNLGQKHVSEVKAAHNSITHIEITPDNQFSQDLNQEVTFAIASPSIAILSEEGKILYYGPYTDGALCGFGLDLVDLTLQKSKVDPDFQWFNILSRGCFCEWIPK